MTVVRDDIDERERERVSIRLFVIIVVFLGLFFAIAFALRYAQKDGHKEWLRFMESTVSADDSFTGILDAYRSADFEALAAEQSSLAAAAAGDSSALEATSALRNKHRRTVLLLIRSQQFPTATLPELSGLGLDAPKPDLTKTNLLTFLLACEARDLMAAGNFSEAAQRWIDLASFGARFRGDDKQTTLTHHLAGLTAMEIASDGILELISAHECSTELLQIFILQLSELEKMPSPLRLGLLGEAERYRETMNTAIGDKNGLNRVLAIYRPELPPAERKQKAESLIAESLSFPQANERFWNQLAPQLWDPYHEQDRLDREWIEGHTTNFWVLLPRLEPGTLLTREAIMITRLRLARQLAIRLLGDEETTLQDPFSGDPLLTRDGTIYSLGPDRDDDNGELRYSPSNGIWSDGDLIITLR